MPGTAQVPPLLETPLLPSLRYKGGLPPGLSFRLASHTAVVAVTMDICEAIDWKTPADVAPITELVGRCTNLAFLHLSLRPAMAYYSSLYTSGLPRLRQLELRGCLRSEHSVASVAVLLQNTRNLEVLALFPLLPDPPKKMWYFSDWDDELRNQGGDEKDDDFGCGVRVPSGVWITDIRCFKHRLRWINLVGYRGRPFERMLAKFLLSKAAALEEFSVSIARGRFSRKPEMARELASWRINRRTSVTFA